MKTLRINSYYSPKFVERSKGGVGFLRCGVYLHGEVERLVGYDICAPANPDDFDGCVHEITHHFASGDKTYKYLFLEGIFPCVVDDKYQCTAFLWYDHQALDRLSDDYSAHGLICLNTDAKSLEYARKMYDERACCL